jgi:hypothetical protein
VHPVPLASRRSSDSESPLRPTRTPRARETPSVTIGRHGPARAEKPGARPRARPRKKTAFRGSGTGARTRGPSESAARAPRMPVCPSGQFRGNCAHNDVHCSLLPDGRPCPKVRRKRAEGKGNMIWGGHPERAGAASAALAQLLVRSDSRSLARPLAGEPLAFWRAHRSYVC